MRILFFGDVHFSRSKSVRERIVTAETVSALADAIPIFQSHKPDLYVAMGDLIQKTKGGDKQQEVSEILQTLKPLSKDLVFLKGNHEEMAFGSSVFSNLLEEHDFNASLHGSLDLGSIIIHRLETVEYWKKGDRSVLVPKSQIEDLKHAAKKPTLLLMHQAPRKQTMDNNFYYEKLGNSNAQSVSDDGFYDIISKISNIKLVIHAHTHWSSATFTGSIPTIGNTSFSEMFGSNIGPLPNPQSYGILDLHDEGKNRFSARWQSLSGTLAYSSLEFSL